MLPRADRPATAAASLPWMLINRLVITYYAKIERFIHIDFNITFKREIASQGGKASGGSFEPGSEKAREAGRKGGSK